MKITAHVPVQQYGFIEIEGDPTEKAEIERLYNEYAEKPVNFRAGDFVELESFTGERVLYDEVAHIYKSLEGKVLMGGSTYSRTKVKPFDSEVMLPACAKAWKVEEDVIADIWQMNKDSSNLFGTALHNALEAVHKHWEVGETIKAVKKPAKVKGVEIPNENYALPKQPVIRKAVLAYIDKFGVEGLPEVLVTDVKNGMAGSIDLLILGNKEAHIVDFKSAVMDDDKIKEYQHQLSWYARILINFGYKVTTELRMWDGDVWESKYLDVAEVTL